MIFLVSSTSLILSDIENSIGMALDTGINDIVITDDLNLNIVSSQSKKKIDDICMQYNLHQLINEPTHFTESSATIIDLILVSNSTRISMSGVSELFLNQDIMFHCPVYNIFKVRII